MEFIYERIKSDQDCQDYIDTYNNIVENCKKKKIRLDNVDKLDEKGMKIYKQLTELGYWLDEWNKEKIIRRNLVPFDLAKKILDIKKKEKDSIELHTNFALYDSDGSLSFPVTYWASGMIQAPLKQQVFDWFESIGYRNYVASNKFDGKVNYFFAITPPGQLTYTDSEGRDSKSDAEIACIEKLIEFYNDDKKIKKKINEKGAKRK